MAKPAGTHQPLSYRAHVRLRALHKNLHSRFQAVRAAAAKEIQAILNKKRGIQNRLRELAVKTARATVRKVTPSQLHKPLRVQKQALQQSPKRGQATPLGAEQARGRGFVPAHGFRQTKAQLKQRARGGASQPQQARQPAPQPAPARRPDAMAQAQAAMRGAHQRSPLLPPPGKTAAHEFRIPGLLDVIPDAPERTQDKGRWEGLRKRLAHRAARSAGPAGAPALDTRLPAARVGDRTRTRTTA